MKLVLNKDELSFMHTGIGTIMQLAEDNDIDSFYQQITLTKLRNKFTPNAGAVFLHKNERSTCAGICEAWLRGVGELSTADRTQVVRTLLEKLEGGTPNENA
jgi:hypothetical protein